MNRKLSDVVIFKNAYGEYTCRGVSESGNPVIFLVPVSSYTKILEHVGRGNFKEAARSLFEAKYAQHEGIEPRDLGTLDSREVDGLFSYIRTTKRRESGGWTKAAGGTGRT